MQVFKEAQRGDHLLFLLHMHLGGWSLCLTSARRCPRTGCRAGGREWGPLWGQSGEAGSCRRPPGSSPQGSRLSPDLCFQDGAPVRGASSPRRRGAGLSEPARPGGPMGFSWDESCLQLNPEEATASGAHTPVAAFRSPPFTKLLL